MPLRLVADANAQTTIPLALAAGATSFVGGTTANFTNPSAFGNGVGRLTFLDAGNGAFNPAAPLATPFEYVDYTSNVVGTNTISGLTRGVAGTTAHAFSAGAIVAQGLLVEDILASVPWKFDEMAPSGVALFTIPASGTIPASYLGVPWRHILIEWVARTSVAGNADVFLQYNGDGAANYSYQQLYGTANTVTFANPTAGVAQGNIGQVPGSPFGTGFGSGSIKINHFASTLIQKIARGDSSYIAATVATSLELRRSMYWNNSAAPITSITFGLSTGTFTAGSLITTYLIP